MRNKATMGGVLAAMVGLAAATGTGLLAEPSQADQSFTLAMEDDARKKWDEKLNKVFAQPFASIACTDGNKMTLTLGKGCVEAPKSNICCDSWSIDIECSDKGKWTQKIIEGNSCKQTPRDDD